MLKKSFLFHFVFILGFFGNALPQTNTSVVPTNQTDKPSMSISSASDSLDERTTLFTGRVFHVVDGDSITVQSDNNKTISIRFQGIDAPEGGQSFGKESRESLASLILGKSVVVVIDKKDIYNRYIADVYLDGQNVSLIQLRAGMAWYYKKYADEQTFENRKRFAQAERDAQLSLLGLWSEKQPKPPWDFRMAAISNPGGTPVNTASSASVKETKAKPENPAGSVKIQPAKAKEIEYFKGPRGGCYYVNANGIKTYVRDKSLCEK